MWLLLAVELKDDAERGVSFLDVAVEALEAAVALDGSNVEAIYNAGFARLQREEKGEARAHFQRALEVSPGFEAAVNALVRVCF